MLNLKSTLVMASAAIALALVLVVSTTSIPQKVYAPAGSRGMFCGDLPDALKGSQPYQSDGALCWCDDVEALQAAADQYFAGK